jgi:predicted nucleic acid-binding protein
VPKPVLVDTSAWIEALRSDGNEEVRRGVRAAVEEGTAVFCDLVRLELWNGARGARERKYLEELERDLETLPATPDVWRRARDLARRCRGRGLTLPATDLLISACAEHHGATLLHRDDHFDRIPEATPPE